MAKKIKFPLEMENGVQVRSIEELKANFSLARVLFYIYNGKLITWLKDRNAQSIADEIEALDIEAPNFFEKVYSIFDINYSDTDIKQAQEINRKLNIFKNNNIEDKYIDVIDSIAFDQSDLYNLVNNNKTKIYLYGDKFLIPLNRINITYIGINNPTIICNEEEKRKYIEKGITFIDVTYDKKYQSTVKPENSSQNTNNNSSNSINIGNYSKNSYLNFMLNQDGKKEAEECYKKISKIIINLNYDIDDDIRDIKKQLIDSGLVGLADNYINNL